MKPENQNLDVPKPPPTANINSKERKIFAISPNQLDAWRIVPRLLVLLYGWLCFDTHQWITALPDPSSAQQLYASVIFTGAAAWFGFYVNSGRKQE